MKTQHTPGPWRLADGVYILGSSSTGNTRSIVCQLGKDDAEGGLGWLDFENREANARLIAAAPELLEALEVLEVACLAYADFSKSQRFCKALSDARAAIQKAKGE